MKHHRHLNAMLAAATVLAALAGIANSAHAQNSSVTQTNIPQSVFVVPTNANEGRDPFYPKSTRLSGGGPVESTTPTAVASFVMNGVSGTPGHRLVMVNGRTMAEGETPDVLTAGGLVKVHCVEIKDKSVVIEVGGVRQELFLRGEN